MRGRRAAVTIFSLSQWPPVDTLRIDTVTGARPSSPRASAAAEIDYPTRDERTSIVDSNIYGLAGAMIDHRDYSTENCGGSNRVRLWKLELQKLADESGLTIKVRHYPPGTSRRVGRRNCTCGLSQNGA